ncbi:uncharacterized protein si:ch211-183d21.1 [Trichomycterus rosablanca]|uniref:uncharacterized protein si:ch211-183d21.1 n=1 Tax=Trichomycterus rosablanca TaxID=2290929 RepID=UPI002F355698
MKEFVELFALSGGSMSLDGYTLVFYNGKGDKAYRVVDLSGHSTDEHGFFLIGSTDLKPSPAIVLPHNSVQNGPDAIALYGPSWVPVHENGNVSAVGLLDAVVYTSRRAQGSADHLARILTPGSEPYLEDEQFLEGDESIQRCWLSDNYYSFQNGSPTPGRANNCQQLAPAHLSIYKIQLGGLRPAGKVELLVGMKKGPMAVVVYDGRTDTVRTSVGFQASKPGDVSVNLNTTALSDLDGWALAVYEGQATDFPKGSPLSQLEPLDAFVSSGLTNMPSANLTETLIPGRKPFKFDSRSSEGGDAYVTRCGVAHWMRDPGVFQLQMQRPSESSYCTWYNTCPYKTAINTTEEQFEPFLPSDLDFLLSELNSDSSGSAEDEEFVELWHPSGQRTSLDGIWLLLFNGNNGKIYREIELHGYYTDNHGYFLIGSDKLGPQIAIPSNTIQNGPDAIAIYRSESSPSSEGLDIPTKGLLDAIVYRSRGSDKETADLISVLMPGQLPLLEYSSAQDDQSLSRCGLHRLDLNSFRLAARTALKDNDCPHPPEELVINEVVSGVMHLPANFFVELSGPAATELHTLVIVLFEVGGVRHSIPLKGRIGDSGFYVLGNVSTADQSLPAITSLSAVWLCFGLSSINNSQIQDVVVLSNDSSLNQFLHGITYQYIHPMSSFDSVSRCATKGSASWTASNSTPGFQNLCPSSIYSSNMDLCLQPEHDVLISCSVETLAAFLEVSCQCGISGPHLAGVNLTCISGSVYAQGEVLALSEHQRELVGKTLQTADTHSCTTIQQRLVNKGSPLWLQVGLVLAVVLLCALGGAIVFYLYKKRRPHDYYSMELNEHETPLDL